MIRWIDLSKGCAKGLLIVLNLLCILVSLCTFGFAVVDINILKQYGEEQSSGTFTGDVVISIASFLLVAVAIFGCVATVKDNVKMLYLYVGFILMLLIIELLLTINVSIRRYGLQFRVMEWIRDDFYKNVTSATVEAHEKLWNDLQTTYECCGLNSPDDYTALGEKISLSCCPRAFRARSEQAKNILYKSCVESGSYYQSGCEIVVLYILQSDSEYLIGVAVITFWFESAGILLAMWVANHVKNSVHVYKHTVKY